MSWRYYKSKDELWARVLQSKYKIKEEEIILPKKVGESQVWRSIRLGSELIASGTKWRLGNGQLINFWIDKWVGDSSLKDY